jgi:4-hydroxy-tetrahydrodipicolinate reductase
VPVAIVGARGRLGTFAGASLRSDPRFVVVAELGREHRLEAVLPECGARVVLEVTRAGLGARHGQAILEAGLSPVIGTSGVTRAETLELDACARARGLGGLVVPNFSLGMLWLNRMAEAAAHAGFASVSILEQHHERKRDAPSASARDTVERLRAAGVAGSIPIHSVRSQGRYAHQEVLFGGPGETLALRHDMLGPEAFGPGIAAAILHAATSVGVAWGLEAVVGAPWDAIAKAPGRAAD